MGKSLLSYNWTFGADIIILTKVLLRCMAQESSAFQISSGGKYRFYICIGHTVQPTCKLNSTPQLTYPPKAQINILSLSLSKQEEHSYFLSNKSFTVEKVVPYVQNCHPRRNKIRMQTCHVLNNHVAKMVVHSFRPIISSRGGHKSQPRVTNKWTRSNFQYYKLTDFNQCKRSSLRPPSHSA